MVPNTNVVDEALLASDVATSGTERLSERSHKDVDRPGVDTVVLGDTTPVGTQCANGVSLIDEEIELESGSVAYRGESKQMITVPCTSP